MKTYTNAQARARFTQIMLISCRIAEDPKIDWRVRSAIEGLQCHFSGYAEPGYSSNGLPIAVANWNKVGEWDDVTHSRRPIVGGDIMNRVGACLAKLGIETEWSDEWVSCDECGKLIRTQPDSHNWEPSYFLPEGSSEVLCQHCAHASALADAEYLGENRAQDDIDDGCETPNCARIRTDDALELENKFGRWGASESVRLVYCNAYDEYMAS
jgi:hypothetical protein